VRELTIALLDEALHVCVDFDNTLRVKQ
jgi:hypothetical protein